MQGVGVYPTNCCPIHLSIRRQLIMECLTAHILCECVNSADMLLEIPYTNLDLITGAQIFWGVHGQFC